MNKKRKQMLSQISNELDNLLNRINAIYDDEQYAYDSMPENLQGSDKGMKSEEALDTLDEIKDQLKDVIDLFGDIS